VKFFFFQFLFSNVRLAVREGQIAQDRTEQVSTAQRLTAELIYRARAPLT
jgi:hypothetical protein